MNHRFLLRLLTNLSISILTLSCFGTVLWVVDEFLQWDILPEALSLLLRALLVAGGIIAFIMVVMNALLSLALLAESNASRAQLPDYTVSRQLKKRINRSILAVIVAIALIIGGLQITDQVRARVARQESLENFTQAQVELNQAAPEVLSLFTPPILEGLENNTLTEQGQLGNTSKLFQAIRTSFPESPYTTILVRSDQAPYKYELIEPSSIRSDGGKTVFVPELYTAFPEAQEVDAVEQLLAGKLPTLSTPLKGKFLDNTLPSTWGVLRRNGKTIAIVFLKSEASDYADPYGARPVSFPYDGYQALDFHHNGPDQLFSN
ncbi:MAG: hypothetical protein DCF25_16160 [Leptolyngbya foveolarum]|uniref:Uncharacterized protein n=1 Tax=Leptolyngbya foveolarum TaxID=47253 RepID=A0A2W4VMA6_9CYAN|nr:MAG: hypothetical protein DCF25_16160 [Leptolyngbya foveolarum]